MAGDTPDVSTILADDNFKQLPLSEKHNVLMRVDPNYKGLPPHEQAKALEGIGYPNPVTVDKPPIQGAEGFAGGLSTGAKRLWDTTTSAFKHPGETMMGAVDAATGAAAIKAGAGAVDAYKRARSGGANVRQAGAMSVAQTALPALPAEDIRARGERGDVAGVVGESLPVIGTELVGMLFGGGPNARKSMANAAAATGVTGKIAKSVRGVMPEVIEGAKQNGVQTVGELSQHVENAKWQAETEYKQALDPIKNRKVDASPVAVALRSKITSAMRMTADGKAKALQLWRAAREFDGKQWSLKELDQERMSRGADVGGAQFKKTSGAANQAMKSDTDLLIDETVRRATADMVYKQMKSVYPKMDVQGLKQRHSQLWELSDHLKKRRDDLEMKQLKYEAKTAGEKLNPRVTAGSGGPHGYLSGMKDILGGKRAGPERVANRQLRRAMGPGAGSAAVKATVMGMPVQKLHDDGEGSDDE